MAFIDSFKANEGNMLGKLNALVDKVNELAVENELTDWEDADLDTPFVADDGGVGADAPAYRLEGRTVWFKGCGTVNADSAGDTTMFTLPEGLRPPSPRLLSIPLSPNSSFDIRVNVNTDGTVVCRTAISDSSNITILFDGVSFPL